MFRKVEELTPDRIVAEIRRPPYSRIIPTCLNQDLLPARWQALHNRIWQSKNAQLPVSRIARLESATVFGTGTTLLSDGTMLADTFLGDEAPPLPSRPAYQIDGPVFLLRKPGDANFGHWLIELIPRVLEARARLPGVPLRFAIPTHPFSMQDLRRVSLAFFGVEESDIIWIDNDPVLFRDLFLMSANSIHSHTHDDQGVCEVAATGRAHFSGPQNNRKIYVRRPADAKRRLLNEETVLTALVRRGFEVIMPEKLTFAEQINIFSEASIIAGVSGAALTNAIWCRPGASVLSLAPASGAEFFFWDLSNICGHHFVTTFGAVEGQDKGVHSDFTVTEEDLNMVLPFIQ